MPLPDKITAQAIIASNFSDRDKVRMLSGEVAVTYVEAIRLSDQAWTPPKKRGRDADH